MNKNIGILITLLVVFLFLVPIQAIAVPQEEAEGNDLTTEEEDDLEFIIPPGDPQQTRFFVKVGFQFYYNIGIFYSIFTGNIPYSANDPSDYIKDMHHTFAFPWGGYTIGEYRTSKSCKQTGIPGFYTWYLGYHQKFEGKDDPNHGRELINQLELNYVGGNLNTIKLVKICGSY